MSTSAVTSTITARGGTLILVRVRYSKANPTASLWRGLGDLSFR